MTISEAAKQVLKEAGRPLKAKELVKEIEARGLFKFNAQQPDSVLASTLRKRSDMFVKSEKGFTLKCSDSDLI